MESRLEYQQILAGARKTLDKSNTTSNAYAAPDKDPFRLDHMYRELASMPFGPNETRLPKETVLFVVATLASVLQVHWWSHCSSCFKQSRNTRAANMCRYLFPRERVENGHIGTSAILLMRKHGEEYINGYSDVILRAFKCNHDIQILIGGDEMAERIYYACKYTTKDQQKVECRTALALAAFDIRTQRERSALDQGEGLSDDVKCRRRLASHMFNMTRKQEVAGPMCALYILCESCSYTSHMYKKLSIHQVLKFLHHHSDTSYGLELTTNLPSVPEADDLFGGGDESSSDDNSESEFSDLEDEVEQPVEIPTKTNMRVFVPVGPGEDYINRPVICADLSGYEYASKYFRGNRTASTPADKLFLEQHSLYGSKCLGIHRLARIPELTGGVRIPYFEDCTKNDQKEYHAQLALVLFKPFRTIADLCSTYSTWHESWEAFQPIMSSLCKEVYHYMQDYHVGRKKAARTRTSREEEQNIQVEGGDGYADDFDDIELENSLRLAVEGPIANNLDLSGIDDARNEFYQSVPSSELRNNVIFPTTIPITGSCAIDSLLDGTSLEEASAITTSKYVSIVGNCDQRQNCRQKLASDIKSLKQWASKKPVEKVVTFETSTEINGTDDTTIEGNPNAHVDVQTIVKLSIPSALEISTMLHTGRVVERGNIPQSLPDFAHIGYVSDAFGLTIRQHLSFVIIARALLLRWQLEKTLDHDSNRVEEAISAIQLRMVMHGEGGTGKSHIIAAVQAFCDSWKRPFGIAKTAMTGKAAVSINGVALHSWIGMHNLAPSTVHEAKEAEEKGLPGFTEDLKLLLVDEMSMMNKQHLVRLDEALRARTKLDIPFGGINIVLAGDFFQMPPVGGNPYLYEDSGFSLWRSFTTVVVLDENVRFAKDPEWGKLVSLARKGVWTQDLVDILNSRIQPQGLILKDMKQKLVSTSDSSGTKRCTTYTTPDNRTRQAIINAYTAALSKKLPVNHYPIRIVANFNGLLNDLSSMDVSSIMSLPDTKLGNMAPFIDFIPGMPVVFTQNVNPQQGIANGTFGILHSVQFDDTTKFKLVQDSGSKLKVLIPSKPPEVVFVRVNRPKHFGSVPRDGLDVSLPPDVYPVFVYKPPALTEVALTPGPGGTKRSIKLRLNQFPFVNAIASTVYKIQGETMESLVVADRKAKSSRYNKAVNTCQQGYIAISRLTKRDGFSALQPLTDECIRYFRPSQETILEGVRLEQEFTRLVSLKETRAIFSSCHYKTLKATLPKPETGSNFQIKRKLGEMDVKSEGTVSSSVQPRLSLAEKMEKNFTELTSIIKCEDAMLNQLETMSLNSSAPTLGAHRSSLYSLVEPNMSRSFCTPASELGHGEIERHVNEPRVTDLMFAGENTPKRNLGKSKRRLLPENPIRNDRSTISSLDDQWEFILQARRLHFKLESLASNDAWIHEDVINLYMESLARSQPSIVCLNSHFFESLEIDPSYQKATRILKKSRYTKNESRCLIFPIFAINHWILGVIELNLKSYGYYDSLHINRPNITNTIQSIVKLLHVDHQRFDNVSPIDGPVQTNNYDCGVYVCIAAKQIFEHFEIGQFEHGDMVAWRLHILNALSRFLVLS
ncbi:hypothetical protein AeMF1_017846 [Aphanomyces euteiches]|nr:hypothetical protein AeMF1_017846 [Aphanomyces euteiches]